MSVLDERNEWLEKRCRGIGGTDIGAILGVSPWSAPIDVYLGKVGLSQGKDLTEAMWWGNFLEEGIAKRYAEKEGKRVLRGRAFADLFPGRNEAWLEHTLIHHRDYPHFLGTPDGLVVNDLSAVPAPIVDRGLEVKNSGFKNDEWGTPGTDHIPTHYLIQCQWYMLITAIPVWDLAVLFSGNHLETFTIHANQELHDTMAEAADDFWKNHVLKQIPPPVDASESYARYLAQRFKQGSEQWIEVADGDHVCQLAANLKRLQKEIEVTEDGERLAKNLLMETIGDKKGVKGPFGKIQWIRSKPGSSVDYEGALTDLATELKVEDEKITELKKKHTAPTQRSPYIRAYFKGQEEN